MEHSKLRPFIADSKTDGPNTVLVIQGFSGREEIDEFMDKMLKSGLLFPNPQLQQ